MRKEVLLYTEETKVNMIFHEANYITQSIKEVDISPENIQKVKDKCWRSYHQTKEEAESALINDQYMAYLNAVEQMEREYQRLINITNRIS